MKVWIDRAGYDGLRCLRKKRSDAAKLKSGNSKSDSSASTAMSEITMQRNYSTTHMLHAALKGQLVAIPQRTILTMQSRRDPNHVVHYAAGPARDHSVPPQLHPTAPAPHSAPSSSFLCVIGRRCSPRTRLRSRHHPERPPRRRHRRNQGEDDRIDPDGTQFQGLQRHWWGYWRFAHDDGLPEVSTVLGDADSTLIRSIRRRRVPIVWNVVGGSTIGIAAGTTFAGYKSL